jgi:hypothetical protein
MALSPAATPAQAVLALYGALDDAAGTGNADIEATIAHYLPGSGGPNIGWYEQLLDYLGHREGHFIEHGTVPDLNSALDILSEAPSEPPAVMREARKKPTKKATAKVAAARGAVADTSPPERPLSTVQKARMVYAIATLSQLPGWYLQSVVGTDWEQKFIGALQLAGGPAHSGLLDHLRLHVSSRDGYPKVVELAEKQSLIDAKVALVPLCQPKVMILRNQPCLVITTEFVSDAVSLDDLKNVIDPANWARCLSSFFCQMDTQDERDDGWSRVLEQVSLTCPIGPTHMKTPLKYWKTEGQDDPKQPPTACLDYALDDQPKAKGDGQIVVDEGFIRMTSTDASLDSSKPGVRVRTRKVVGFSNSAITPWGVLACSMGYGDQGIDMILDGVDNYRNDPVGWTTWTVSVSKPSKGPTQPKTPPAQPPSTPDTSRRAVELAVEMLGECMDDMSEKSAAVAAKWAKGALPITEMIELNADFATRLVTDPWRYLERLRNPTHGGGK